MTDKGSHWTRNPSKEGEKSKTKARPHLLGPLQDLGFGRNCLPPTFIISPHPLLPHREEMLLETSLRLWWCKASLLHSILGRWGLTGFSQRRQLVNVPLGASRALGALLVILVPFSYGFLPLVLPSIQRRAQKHGMGLGVAMVSRGSLGTHKSSGFLWYLSDITLAWLQSFLSGHIYLKTFGYMSMFRTYLAFLLL